VLINKFKSAYKMLSNKIPKNNRFTALFNDEHYEDDIQDEVQDEHQEQTTGVEQIANSNSSSNSSSPKSSNPKTWASTVSDASPEGSTTGEPNSPIVSKVYIPTIILETSNTSTVSDSSEVDGGGWTSVGGTSKPKKNRKNNYPTNSNSGDKGYKSDKGYKGGRKHEYTGNRNNYHNRNGSGSSKTSEKDNDSTYANVATDETDETDETDATDTTVLVAKKIMDIPISSGSGFTERSKTDNETKTSHVSSYASVSTRASEITSSDEQNPRARSNIARKPISENNNTVGKKSFSAKAVQNKGSIVLPDYYGKRSSQNQFEIPQCEYEWVKRVGGLEKSTALDHMFKGAMGCAIAYYDNYMAKNKFFTGKISIDENKQNELIELVCMQTTAILFHRLLKSDTCEIVKTILKNLPLYRTVSGNPSERSSTARTSIGSLAYMRVRRRFIDDLRTFKTGTASEAEKNEARLRVTAIEDKWSKYILQSVWNGNNPIHDCLFYGAKSSLEYLLCHYFENSMHHQLNHMMLVPNIQDETHDKILENGIKACDAQGSLNIIRKKQYNECGHLYNNTVKALHAQIHNIVKDEADEIISKSAISSMYDTALKSAVDTEFKTDSTANITSVSEIDVEIDNLTMNANTDGITSGAIGSMGSVTSTIADVESDDAEGDDVNICSLISNGDVEGMCKHIERCAKNKQYKIIDKTFELWRAAADSDSSGQLNDYLTDVNFLCEDYLKNRPADLTSTI
jgi:hypothetical protein